MSGAGRLPLFPAKPPPRPDELGAWAWQQEILPTLIGYVTISHAFHRVDPLPRHLHDSTPNNVPVPLNASMPFSNCDALLWLFE